MPKNTSELLFNQALSHVISDDASLLAANGTTPSTIAIYRINLSLGEALVGGDYLKQIALVDTVLIGTGTWGKSIKLDGSAAAVLSADGKTYWVALVAVPINGAPALYAVFGAEAADTFEVALTPAQIVAALTAALGTTYNPNFGLILNRVKLQRVGGAIVVTVTDPATDNALKGERLAGTLAV